MDNQETQIHKIVVGIFGVASGSDLFAVMNSFTEANGTQALALRLATFLPEATIEERTADLMDNFGFVADDDLESPGSLAQSYISGRLEAGANAGQVALNVVTFLSSESLATDFPAFLPWANLLTNKAQLASIYSANFPSTTLEELAAPLNVDNIPTDSILTEVAAIALLAAGGIDIDVPTSFTLTAQADSVSEGDALTYTVTASEPVTTDTDVVFTVAPGDSTAADQGTNTTNLNDFSSGTFNPVTTTITAGNTTATFTVTATDDGVTELTETFSVQAAVDGTTLTAQTTLLDSAASSVITLTTGADNIPGTTGADIINGFVGTAATSTLTGADTIAGNGAIDTLNITNSSNAGVTDTNGALVSAIEIFNLRGLTASDTFAFNASSTAGVTEINNFQSLGALTVTNVPAGASIGVIGNGSVLNGATTATYVAGVTDQILKIKDGAISAAPININSTSPADPTSLTIFSTGAANTVGAIIANGTVTTTTINADSPLTVGGLSIGTKAATQALVISGAANDATATTVTPENSAIVLGGILDTDFASVDASGLTAGGVSVQLSTNVATTFTGGSGQDMVLTGATGQTGAVNAAGGDKDVLALTAATHIDTPAEGAIYQGFEILFSTSAAIDMDLITGSTITGVWLSGPGSNVTDMNATQAANVTVLGPLGATTLGIKDATVVGNVDTLAMTITDRDTTTSESLVTAGDITMTGVENITINAIDDATFATMANITGMTNLTVSGGGDVNITTGAQALAVNSTFDFSGLTGTSTFNAAAATTNAFAFTGGSNVDTVTDNVLGGNNINTGSGNDFITLTAKTGGTSGTSVTGGAGADTVVNKVIGSGASNGLVFNYTAGDSVSDSSTTGISATLTDTITGLDGATLAAAAGISAEFDTEVQATAVTAGNTDVVLGTTSVANAGDFFVNIDSATTAFIYQDTDGDTVIEAGEFAVALTGIGTDTLLAADFTIASGDLMLITT